ncbi:MAG: hypothetical protein NVS3B10_00530 [Polyangiales bacterium]
MSEASPPSFVPLVPGEVRVHGPTVENAAYQMWWLDRDGMAHGLVVATAEEAASRVRGALHALWPDSYPTEGFDEEAAIRGMRMPTVSFAWHPWTPTPSPEVT